MRTTLWIGLLSCLLVGCHGKSSSNGDLGGHDLASSHDLAGLDLSGYDLASYDLSQGGDLSSSVPDFSGVDLSGRVCFPLGTCTQPNCGSTCCAGGEWCDNGTCRCGQGNACTDGNMCTGLPVAGGNGCGNICCGHTSPCPG